MEVWKPGRNHPLIGRGGRRESLCHGRSLCIKSQIIVGNLLWNVLHKDDMKPVLQAWAMCTGYRNHQSATGDRQPESATGDDGSDSRNVMVAVRMVADMTGMNYNTVFALATKFKKSGWVLQPCGVAKDIAEEFNRKSGQNISEKVPVGEPMHTETNAVPPILMHTDTNALPPILCRRGGIVWTQIQNPMQKLRLSKAGPWRLWKGGKSILITGAP